MVANLELYTERLTLKVLDETFAPVVLDYHQRNREFWREWNPLTPDSFYTLEAQRERLRADMAQLAAGQGLRLYLFQRGDLAQIVGDLGFNNIVRGSFQSCHLGYKIDIGAANQGYITEALRRAIAYAFDELKLHRIEANVMPHNARSRRVVAKLGFAEEGMARKYLKINGAWEDHIHYVMLNDAV